MWAGDVAAWVRENALLLAPDGRLDLLTLTAPGQDYLPWDRAACTHDPAERCSGPKGCRCAEPWLSRWNASAPRRLTDLMNAAHVYAGRELGRSRPEWIAMWEEQSRGPLHAHFLTAARDRPYWLAVLAYVRRNAERHGFGVQVDFTPCRDKSKAAAYLYKTVAYVTKAVAIGGDERAQLFGLLNGPLRGRSFMRSSPKLTARTRCTMRNLRYRRYLSVRGLRGLDCARVDALRLADEREAAERVRELENLADLRRVFCRPPPLPWHGPRPVLALDQMRLRLPAA